MNKLLLIIFITAITQIPVQTFAQKQGQALIDSLKTELAKARQDTNRVNILNKLSAEAGWRVGNHDTALHYAAEAKALAEELDFKKGTGDAYNNIGIVYENQGNFPEALENYFTSLKIGEEIGDKKGIAASYNNIGIVYFYQGNYPEALKNYFAALKIEEDASTGSAGDKRGIANSYNNIGNVYQNQGNYPEALENHFASLKIREEIGDKRGIAGSYINIGNVYQNQDNYPEALENYFASLKIKEEIGDKRGIANSYICIGAVYGRQGNYPEALENYFAALKIKEEIGDKQGIAYAYSNIGNVYSGQGNYPEALKNYFAALKIWEEIGDKRGIADSYGNIGNAYTKLNQAAEGKTWLQKSLRLSRDIGTKESIKDAYDYLSKADSALGNFKGAFENHKMYIVYKDSIFNEENTKKLTQTEMQYEFDKKEAATKAGQEKKDIRQRNIRNSSFAAVGALLLFSLVVVRQRNKVKKEKQRSEELLLNILPEEVAQELKEKGSAEARQFDEVSVLFTDFVHFTQTSEQLTPQQLVQELNECFTAFDNIIERNNLEKIKTVGDAYMAVCGLPVSDPRHAQKTVKAALEIRDFIEERKKQERVFEIRIGINSGSVVAGIVGVKKFAYDIWGDTVNTAARMEQNGEAGKINISETTFELVKGNFECIYRGEVEAKGKGMMKMYFVK